jgi:hypothetical protein
MGTWGRKKPTDSMKGPPWSSESRSAAQDAILWSGMSSSRSGKAPQSHRGCPLGRLSFFSGNGPNPPMAPP